MLNQMIKELKEGYEHKNNLKETFGKILVIGEKKFLETLTKNNTFISKEQVQLSDSLEDKHLKQASTLIIQRLPPLMQFVNRRKYSYFIQKVQNLKEDEFFMMFMKKGKFYTATCPLDSKLENVLKKVEGL